MEAESEEVRMDIILGIVIALVILAGLDNRLWEEQE